MSWVRARTNLRRDPKVIAVARHLSASPKFIHWWVKPIGIATESVTNVTEIVTFANVTRVTVCSLIDIWGTLNETLSGDGIAPYMVIEDIDGIAEIPGIGRAMEAVGWAKELPSGGVQFPNFEEHNSPEKERVALTPAERAKRYRDRKKQKQEGGDDTENGTVTPVTKVTVEERREEKSTVSVPSEPHPKPKEDRFEEFWGGVPNKIGKGAARKAWGKALKAGADPADIIAGIPAFQAYEKQRKALDKHDYRGLHPSTWINGSRWEDDPPSPTPDGNKNTFGNRKATITKASEMTDDDQPPSNL